RRRVHGIIRIENEKPVEKTNPFVDFRKTVQAVPLVPDGLIRLQTNHIDDVFGVLIRTDKQSIIYPRHLGYTSPHFIFDTLKFQIGLVIRVTKEIPMHISIQSFEYAFIFERATR